MEYLSRLLPSPEDLRASMRALFGAWVFMLIGCIASTSAVAQTLVSGNISTDTIWQPAGNPYVVSGNLQVTNGAVLRIEAGAQIYMASGASLAINASALQANGSAIAPIRIQSDKVRLGHAASPGDWNRLIFNNSALTSTLNFVIVDHGKGLEVNGTQLQINNSQIRKQQGAAITQDLAASLAGQGNVAIDNSWNAVMIPAGVITSKVSLGLKGIPYLVEGGQLTVGAPSLLQSISPNTIERGSSDVFTLTGNQIDGLYEVRTSAAGLQSQISNSINGQVMISALPSASLGAVTLTAMTDRGEAQGSVQLFVTRAQPRITAVTPASTRASQDTTTLSLQGFNFLPSTQILVNGLPIATQYISSTSLLGNKVFNAIGIEMISLQTPDPDNFGNILASNSIPFVIYADGNSADLAVSNVAVQDRVLNSDASFNISLSYRIANLGGAATTRTFATGIYMAAQGAAFNDSVQILAGSSRRDTPLNPGESYTVTQTVRSFGALAAGTYTLFVKADALGGPYGWPVDDTRYPCAGATSSYSQNCTLNYAGGQIAGLPTSAGVIAEANESNNVASTIMSLAPDLAVSDVVFQEGVLNSDYSYSIRLSYKVSNVGQVAIQRTFATGIYMAAQGAAFNDSVQILAGSSKRTIPLNPGESYTVTQTVRSFGALAAGTYTLFVKADALGGPYGWPVDDTRYPCAGATSSYSQNCTLNYAGGQIAGLPTSAGVISEENESNNVASTFIFLVAP